MIDIVVDDVAVILMSLMSRLMMLMSRLMMLPLMMLMSRLMMLWLLMLRRNIRQGSYIEVAEVAIAVDEVAIAVDEFAVDFAENFDVVAVVAKNIILRLNHKFLFHFHLFVYYISLAT